MLESRHEGELNLLLHKLNSISSDRDILDKQLRHLQSEYGQIILKDNAKTCELAELRAELKERDHAVLVSQLAETRLELKQMKHEAETARIENVKLKMAKDAVVNAATNNLRGFQKRVDALEGGLVKLKLAIQSAGAQKETLESSRPTDRQDGFVETRSVSGTTPPEEISASSLSCKPVVNTVRVKEQQNNFGTIAKDKGLLRCQTKPSIAVKTDSLRPSVTEKYSSASLPICISDSDDDGEPKGRKRKLDFNDAADHSKTPMTPKQTQQKIAKSDNDVEVESVNSSAKQWDYEADMVDDLEKNPEICMRAICALYRQHVTVGPSKGFNEINAFRGKVLGKFLVDGDLHGGVKRSVAKLMEFDRDGANMCRRIVMDHTSRLFEIYKNKEDTHFAPPL
ncbi:hypothetical protein vseg_020178 [Gypsophila vaccaria]